MLNLISVILDLFDDGEGAGTDQQTADDFGTDFGHQSDEGADDEPIIVYGKQDQEPDNDSQSGSDAQTQQNHNNANEGQPFRVYRTHEEFQAEIDRIIGTRLKDYREKTEMLNQYDPVLKNLMRYHQVNSIDELNRLVEDEIIDEVAEKEGFASKEKYREHMQLKAELERQQQLEQERQRQQFVDRVMNEVNELRGTKEKPGPYPNLDLAKELANQKFADLINLGWSVKEAYEVVHKDELLRNAAKTAEQQLIANMRVKAQRIPENGARKPAGVVVKNDPSKFTDEDIDAIRERVARGERIRF